jgi:hypothetical protein
MAAVAIMLRRAMSVDWVNTHAAQVRLTARIVRSAYQPVLSGEGVLLTRMDVA